MTRKPDVDKLIRAVLDALCGVLYRDDSQVTQVVGLKRYARNMPEGVLITASPKDEIPDYDGASDVGGEGVGWWEKEILGFDTGASGWEVENGRFRKPDEK